MANVHLTQDMLVQRLLFEVKNQLTFSEHVFKGYRDEYHAVGGFKKGSVVRIPLPNKYRAVKAVGVSVVDTYDRSTTVDVDVQAHVALRFTGQELTLDLERFARRHLVPAAITLANTVDADGLEETLNIYNLVGTPGTPPATFRFLADAAEKMDNEAVPRVGRVGVFSPKAHWSMAAGELKSLFNEAIVDTMVRKGFIGKFALTDFFMDQNVVNHTTGTGDAECDGSTVQVNASPAEGATAIVLKGMSGGLTLTPGTVFTIAAVVGVNPVSGKAWEGNELRQFVVTSLATESGTITVNVDPPFISSSATSTTLLPHQTIVTLPQTNAVVTTYSQAASTAFPQNIFMHPETFALTMVPFEKPESAGQSVKWAQATDEDLGLSITLTTYWDGDNFRETHRADILYGWDTIRPELAVRGTG